MAKDESTKMVEICLFEDGVNYTGDVFVAVNGENYLIKRGETVMVPDYIAKALQESQQMDALAIKRKRAAKERAKQD